MGLDQSWRERAACRGMGPERFVIGGDHQARGLTVEQAARVASARLVCSVCTVRVPCLRFAVWAGEKGGVWGGRYIAERDLPRLRAALRAGVLPDDDGPLAA